MDKKREKEKRILTHMVRLYCRKQHKEKELCPACCELLLYAHSKIDRCPVMESKTFCSSCKIHCYRKEMRERIRCVMRFSGPRMMVYHPLLVLKHLLD